MPQSHESVPEQLDQVRTVYASSVPKLEHARLLADSLMERLVNMAKSMDDILALDPRQGDEELGQGNLLEETTQASQHAWDRLTQGRRTLARTSEGTQNAKLKDAVRCSDIIAEHQPTSENNRPTAAYAGDLAIEAFDGLYFACEKLEQAYNAYRDVSIALDTGAQSSRQVVSRIDEYLWEL